MHDSSYFRLSDCFQITFLQSKFDFLKQFKSLQVAFFQVEMVDFSGHSVKVSSIDNGDLWI